jgi:hypothetical protein
MAEASGLNANFFSARESQVTVESERLAGLQSLEYKIVKNPIDIVGTGSDKRQGFDYGVLSVTGKLKIKSVSKTLDAKFLETDPDKAMFTMTAELKGGAKTSAISRKLTFTECYLADREFSMDVNGVGIVVYSFTCKEVTGDK